MVKVDSVWLYAGDATLSTATPLFKLDAVDVEYSIDRAIDPIQIPGQEWNTYFDNQNMDCKIVINGRFSATDETWNGTTFRGRPFDFIQNLKTTLNLLSATDGGTITDAGKTTFKLIIKQYFGGKLYSYCPTIFGSGNPIEELDPSITTVTGTIKGYCLLERHYFKMSGGEPCIVDYNLTFMEVSDVINMRIG